MLKMDVTWISKLIRQNDEPANNIIIKLTWVSSLVSKAVIQGTDTGLQDSPSALWLTQGVS